VKIGRILSRNQTLRFATAPGAEDESADREGNERPAHVDENERPWVRFEGGERGNGGVFDKEKGEPADERDGKSASGVVRVLARDQPGQRVVYDDGRDDRDDVGHRAVRALNVGHSPGVKI
jgi:hypothetical protein